MSSNKNVISAGLKGYSESGSQPKPSHHNTPKCMYLQEVKGANHVRGRSVARMIKYGMSYPSRSETRHWNNVYGKKDNYPELYGHYSTDNPTTGEEDWIVDRYCHVWGDKLADRLAGIDSYRQEAYRQYWDREEQKEPEEDDNTLLWGAVFDYSQMHIRKGHQYCVTRWGKYLKKGMCVPEVRGEHSNLPLYSDEDDEDLEYSAAEDRQLRSSAAHFVGKSSDFRPGVDRLFLAYRHFPIMDGNHPIGDLPEWKDWDNHMNIRLILEKYLMPGVNDETCGNAKELYNWANTRGRIPMNTTSLRHIYWKYVFDE